MTMFSTPKFLARAFALALTATLCVPALADEPSQARLDLAGKMLTAAGMRGSIDDLAPALLTEIERALASQHPEMKAALHEALLAAQPDVVKSTASVFADVVHVAAARMSEQELKEAVTFFESAAGKKYLETQGPVLAELNISFGAWRQKEQGELLTRLREDLKKKGFEF